jgi:hypothetical protein
MDGLALRLVVLVNVILPLLLLMATVYLALHIVFARVIGNRESPALWFFSVITGPLTRPVRAVLPPGMPEARVRTIALFAYLGLWVLVRVIFTQLLPIIVG